MNRIWIVLFCFIVFSCTSTGSSKKISENNVTEATTSGYYSFDNALTEGIKKIQSELPKSSKLAILAFKSDNKNLSSYIVEEMYDKLINLKMTVLERSFTDAIAMEVGYQFSGEVDDREIVKIGHQLGANYVVTGQITFSGEAYRLRVFAIDIEKGQRIASSSLNISSTDRQINHLITSGNPQAQTQTVKQREPENYQGHPIYRTTRQGEEQVLVGFYYTYSSATENIAYTMFVYTPKVNYNKFIEEMKRGFNKISTDRLNKIPTSSSQRMKDAFTLLNDYAALDMALFTEDKSPSYYNYNLGWLIFSTEYRLSNWSNGTDITIILLTDKI